MASFFCIYDLLDLTYEPIYTYIIHIRKVYRPFLKGPQTLKSTSFGVYMNKNKNTASGVVFVALS